MKFQTTFSREMRERAKKRGMGLFVIGFETPTGGRFEVVGPISQKSLKRFRRMMDRFIDSSIGE